MVQLPVYNSGFINHSPMSHILLGEAQIEPAGSDMVAQSVLRTEG
jgi:hypothetical protein